MRDGGNVPSVSNGDDTFYVCADIERITEKKKNEKISSKIYGDRPMKYDRKTRDKSMRILVVVINDKYRLNIN